MAARKIVLLGHTVSGKCSACDNHSRTGETTTCSWAVVDGKGMCVDGNEVTASCGHKGTLKASSTLFTVDGKGVILEGDTFTGTFHGTVDVTAAADAPGTFNGTVDA